MYPLYSGGGAMYPLYSGGGTMYPLYLGGGAITKIITHHHSTHTITIREVHTLYSRGTCAHMVIKHWNITNDDGPQMTYKVCV